MNRVIYHALLTLHHWTFRIRSCLANSLDYFAADEHRHHRVMAPVTHRSATGFAFASLSCQAVWRNCRAQRITRPIVAPAYRDGVAKVAKNDVRPGGEEGRRLTFGSLFGEQRMLASGEGLRRSSSRCLRRGYGCSWGEPL